MMKERRRDGNLKRTVQPGHFLSPWGQETQNSAKERTTCDDMFMAHVMIYAEMDIEGPEAKISLLAVGKSYTTVFHDTFVSIPIIRGITSFPFTMISICRML